MKFSFSDKISVAPRYAGKPFSFKVKYFVAHSPGIVLALLIGCVLTPIGAIIKYPFVKDSVHQSLDKFQPKYTVVRDDDPKLAELIRIRDLNKEKFPKF